MDRARARSPSTTSPITAQVGFHYENDDGGWRQQLTWQTMLSPDTAINVSWNTSAPDSLPRLTNSPDHPYCFHEWHYSSHYELCERWGQLYRIQ